MLSIQFKLLVDSSLLTAVLANVMSWCDWLGVEGEALREGLSVDRTIKEISKLLWLVQLETLRRGLYPCS